MDYYNKYLKYKKKYLKLKNQYGSGTQVQSINIYSCNKTEKNEFDHIKEDIDLDGIDDDDEIEILQARIADSLNKGRAYNIGLSQDDIRLYKIDNDKSPFFPTKYLKKSELVNDNINYCYDLINIGSHINKYLVPKEIQQSKLNNGDELFDTIFISDSTLKNSDYNNGEIIKYTGETKDGKPNGEGKAIYQTESIYEGEFKDGLPNGNGELTIFNGTTVKGEFKDGIPHGRISITKFNNGKQIETFSGLYKDGKIEGLGTERMFNGNIFEGIYHDDLPNGWGKLIYSNGDYREGEFENGMFKNGKIKITNNDGSVYEATQIDINKMNGKLIFLDDEVFEGEFKNGVLIKGEKRFADGSIFKGEFEDGWLIKGEKRFADGNYEEGEFENGQLIKGERKLSDGKIVEFENGKKKE